MLPWTLILGVVAATVLVLVTLVRVHARHKLRRLLSSRRDQHVVLLGASSGVGEHLAYEYAMRGAHIVLAARRADRLERVKSHCLDLGAAAVLTVSTDATNVAALRNLRDESIKFFPDGHINAVVYCAGILNVCPFDVLLDTPGQENDEQAARIVDRMFNINALAPIHLARIFLPALRATADHIAATTDVRERGPVPVVAPSLTVISSVAGLLPAPSRALYCSSKAAMHGFFDSLRIEEQRRVALLTKAHDVRLDADVDRHLAYAPLPVQIRLVAPGTIGGTDLRQTAADASLWREGFPQGSNKAAMTPEFVAKEMFMQSEDVLVLPTWYWGAVAIRSVAPGLIDFMASKKYK
ncbi:hypothetical protein GGF32_004463 [Allomyces javanicus]|nr:hypothetical protein GGF32_004463 [Allomyces javanicus]